MRDVIFLNRRISSYYRHVLIIQFLFSMAMFFNLMLICKSKAQLNYWEPYNGTSFALAIYIHCINPTCACVKAQGL